MADLDLVSVSYDGTSINDATYKSGVTGMAWGLPDYIIDRLARVDNYPAITNVERGGRTINLFVQILEAHADKRGARDTLAALFDPDDKTPKSFIVEDEDGSNDRFIDCIVASFQPLVTGGEVTRDGFNVVLISHGTPFWRKTTQTTDAWNITASGQTNVWANAGTRETFPIITIQPTAAKSGTSTSLFKQFIPWRWRTDFAFTRYPLDVVDILDTQSLVESATTTTLDGAINDSVATISLIDASSFATRGMAQIADGVTNDEQISWTGKSTNDLTGVTRGIGGTSAAAHSGGQTIAVSKALANGADVLIEVNGVDVDYWLDSWDSASTKIWVTDLNWAKQWNSTIAAAIGIGDTVTSIVVDDSVVDSPDSGLLFINNEAFSYSSRDKKTKTFTISDRAAVGTSAANHSLGDTIWWCQNLIYLKYGDETATAPSTDDDYKPIFNLNTSTNGSWVYADFGDDNLKRGGQWQKSTDYGTPIFTTANQATDTSPWSDIGVTAAGNERGRYVLYNPCEITNVNATNGEKWSDDVANFIASLSSWTGKKWEVEFQIPVPGVASTWEAWSDNQAITAGRVKVSLECSAKTGGTTNKAEMADATVTLNSSKVPLIGSFSESSMYDLDAVIANTETGESIRVTHKMSVNDELEIDTRPTLEGGKTVEDATNGLSAFSALTLVGDNRRDWFKLDPGNNEWTYTETGATGVTISLEWYQRDY